jgi:threonine synthase
MAPLMNNNLIGYRCVACGNAQPAEPPPLLCPGCGGNLDAEYDYDRIAAQLTPGRLASDPERSLWRYRALLPVAGAPANRSLQVGGTPLVALPGLAGKFDLSALYIKDETRQPSGSLKDRATEVALQHASEHGQSTLVAASTGNAAASLATLAAHHGRRAVILVPAGASAGKLVPILQCGGVLCPVDGTYDEAFDLAEAVAGELGWYSRNSGSNPVLSEGKKTVALEIAEQLHWQVPDKVFVPVGDGCIIGGVYKGFYDLLQLG